MSLSNFPKKCTGLSFEECELTLLRSAVDDAEMYQGVELVNTPRIKKILQIVEKFIESKKLLIYGGTAINNILPKHSQFYNTEIEIPDYDFYSPDALTHAKELADIYVKKGFNEVEAKSGVHHGTYKVFVDFIPVADITQMQPELYDVLHRHAIIKKNLRYAPANFLRMSMYLELSRPKGDVGRWEKVLKRLTLLNKFYPVSNEYCPDIDYKRPMDYPNSTQTTKQLQEKTNDIYNIVLKELVKNDAVFFGGFAISKYSEHMPKKVRKKINKTPDFDVISTNPKVLSEKIKKQLASKGINNVSITLHDGVQDLISDNYEIKVGDDTISFIYTPVACHGYNVVKSEYGPIRIATIDTMLSFYLAFLYIDRPYYDTHRILCMAKYLFKLEEKNRLSQKGVLRRFSLICVGQQPTLSDIRSEKAIKFNKLKKTDPEYESWFLSYRPRPTPTKDKHTKKVKKVKTKKKHTKTRKT